jgi:hypothetical protein
MKKAAKNMYLVFLSHSSRDNWLANVIAQKMRAAGIEIWIDEMSLSGGDEVLPVIISGMKKAKEAVVVVSNESIRTQWVAAEIGMAVALGKRITPLLNNIDQDAMAPLRGVKSYELNKFDVFFCGK